MNSSCACVTHGAWLLMLSGLELRHEASGPCDSLLRSACQSGALNATYCDLSSSWQRLDAEAVAWMARDAAECDGGKNSFLDARAWEAIVAPSSRPTPSDPAAHVIESRKHPFNLTAQELATYWFFYWEGPSPDSTAYAEAGMVPSGLPADAV